MQVSQFVNCVIDISRAIIFLANVIFHVCLFVFFMGTVTPGKDKNQKEEENKGLFSKFRKSKKKSDQVMQYFSCADYAKIQLYEKVTSNAQREVCLLWFAIG